MSSRQLALTFDAEHPDRPHCPPGGPERLLDILSEEKVRATFFLQGRWATAYPATARRIAADGHQVGNHSFYHARLPLLSEVGIETDIQMAELAIEETVGSSPRPLFRCPFGDGADMERVDRALAKLGYRNVHWDVDSMDWDPQSELEGMLERIRAELDRTGPEVVLLMHSWPAITTEALPRIISMARAAGYEFSCALSR